MTFPCLGADPDARAPRFAMPAGATDAHAHVIGVPPAYPFVPERSYTPPEATLAAYQAMHAALGIERAVLVTPSVHGSDNRVILEGIAGYGIERCRGVIVVEPDIEEAELERLHGLGVRGVRLNIMFGGGVGLEAFEALAPKIKPLGWHIELLIPVGENLVDLEPIIRRCGAPVSVCHMGFQPVSEPLETPGFLSLLRLVGDGVAWAKLSGNYRIAGDHPHYRSAIPTAQALIAANPERMIWGTDWPHVSLKENMPNDGDLLDALDDYAPDAALKKAILVDNPAALFGF